MSKYFISFHFTIVIFTYFGSCFNYFIFLLNKSTEVLEACFHCGPVYSPVFLTAVAAVTPECPSRYQ